MGLAMTFIGAYIVFLSLKARPNEVETRGMGVIFIGPIPIVIGGNRKWIVVALGITAIIIIFMLTKTMSSDLIGW